MPAWIKLKLIKRPFYDPRTGRVINPMGRRNRPGIDPYEGGGKVYPEEALKLKRLDWRERGTTLMLLVDEPQEEIDRVKAMAGRVTYQASPKEVREYDLSEHAPAELTEAEALETLKKEIGLPADTALDAEARPVIPEKAVK